MRPTSPSRLRWLLIVGAASVAAGSWLQPWTSHISSMFLPPSPWRSVAIGSNGDIDLRLEYLPTATLTTEEWLRWNVVHSGANTLKPTRILARIEAQRFDDKNWQAIDRQAFLIAHGHPALPGIPAGVNRMVIPDARRRLLDRGVPSADGWLVRCRAHVDMQFADGGSISTPSAGVPFEFEWQRTTPSLCELARKQLRQLLAKTEETDVDVALLSTLLDLPPFREGIALTEFTEALERADPNGRGKRGVLARHLRELGIPEQQLVDYFSQRLSSGSPYAAADLFHARTEAWSDSFLEPLLQMHESHEGFHALRLLEHYAKHWSSKPTARERIFDATMSKRSKWLTASISELTAAHPLHGPYGATHSWQVAAQELAISRAASALPILKPYLNDTGWLQPENRMSRAANGIAHRIGPLRVCDVALEAILKVLHGDVAAGYAALGGNYVLSASAEEAFNEHRDELIRKLLLELNK